MTCLGCERDAGYNRAVVERPNARRLGGLCVRCEEQTFGALLQRTERRGDGCALCERDGSYALPEWRPDAEEADDGSLVARVDYEVDGATVHLCDRHLRLLEEHGAPASPGGTNA